MNKYPFCTVIVPAYNAETTISLLLRSLARQDYHGKYEVIVVDNHSADKTVEKVEKFPQVRILHEVDIQSSYAARNRGIRNAKGGVLAFIDADCVARPNWLEEGVKILLSKNADLAAGNVEFTFKKKVPSVYEYIDSVRKLNQRGYVRKGFGATANLFVRKGVFEKIGYFRQDLQSGGDYEFGKRAIKRGMKIRYTKKALVLHPARDSLRELIKKTKRVAKGQAQLQKMGILEEYPLNLLSFLPTASLSQNHYYQYFSGRDKILMLIITNYIKYTNLFYRLYYLFTL